MGKQTSMEERMRIWALAETGWNDKEIAATVGCTIATARKWRRRLQREGRTGLASQMGRPASGALSGFAEHVQAAISQMREAHPGWGPATLVAELRADPELEHAHLPSRATVARYLRAQGWTRTYERHSELADTEWSVASRPHEVWEMDAQGHAYVPDVGTISLINLNDRYSHARLLSYPGQVGGRRWQRHLNTED